MAQSQWGAGVMVIAWSLAEIPRYIFYIFALLSGDATKGTPYPLFWIRYSAFMILYPSGITGELTVLYSATRDSNFLNMFGEHFAGIIYVLFMLTMSSYVLGGPLMIMNMLGNRKSAFKKRFAKPPPPPRGLVFPLDKNGTRSSTPVAKQILAAAIAAVDPAKGQDVFKENNWRFGYVKHLLAMVEEQCKSPQNALKLATAGLDKAYETFQFVSSDGNSISLAKAMSAPHPNKFKTGFIKGEGKPNKNELQVPYKGTTLKGQQLKDQVKNWVDKGTIESTAGDAIINCVDNPNWLDLSDRYFVLLGAGSAMGPFLVLMALGANVIAIDLDRPHIWNRLITIAKASAGSITFPISVEQKSCKDDDALYAAAGCNLFTHTPRIRDWLLDLYPGKKFTVGSYAYLDGALHVQVSLAMDAICRDLSENRKASLAYLCTPTDLHLIPKEAHEASLNAYSVFSKRLFCIIMSMFNSKKFLRKNARDPVEGEGGPFYLVNGISVAQGPNYALAKRMQHWRAIIARSKGCTVSSNIAPATSTVSVVHNRTFAWAYEGMPYFTPYEIFAPETSNAVMSAILLSDLNDPNSVANPLNDKVKNPNQLFQYGSFHGGNWRCAYEVDSIGEASVILYFSRIAGPYFGIAAAIAAATIGVFFAMS